VFVLATSKPSTTRAADSPLLGKVSPPLTGEAVTVNAGEKYDLVDQAGKWVLVNFFATWCVPCQQEHPNLLSFDRRNTPADQIQLISVVFNDDLGAVRDFFAQNGGTWPVVNGDQGRMALDYSVIRVPDTYIIDPLGVVRARIPRPLANADELDQTIAALSTKFFGASSSGP
jgi:cytochrome c biogenesis protein CcmG/thiol:disulfide interchange protein DsbE